MSETSSVMDALSALERAFIDEFLRSRGYTPEVLRTLPRRAAEEVLAEAAEAASLLLAQIESRAQYLQELHGHKSE